MRLDTERGSKSADDYINSMAKSASAEELRMMRAQPTEQTKMAYFYRYWCLKEAILKVILDVVETVYKILADADRSVRCVAILISILNNLNLSNLSNNKVTFRFSLFPTSKFP